MCTRNDANYFNNKTYTYRESYKMISNLQIFYKYKTFLTIKYSTGLISTNKYDSSHKYFKRF